MVSPSPWQAAGEGNPHDPRAPRRPGGDGFLSKSGAGSSVGVRTRTEIGWRSIGVDCCRKREQPWRAVQALRSALAGAPFWLYAGGVAPCPEPRGLKARRPVFRQVLTPRLPGPFPGIGCEKPNRKYHHHGKHQRTAS